jgi:hypothetical protein
MGKSNNKSFKRTVDPRRIKADKIATELRIGGLRRTNSLFSLKMKSDASEMLYFLKNSLRNRDVLSTFHGEPFPSRVEQLYSIRTYGRPARLHSELIWGLYRASLFKKELTEFTKLRNDFERAILLDSRDDARSLLDQVEDGFGISLWLIQNRLSLAQVWDGLEEKRRQASEYLSKAPNNSLSKFLINFISKRSEATGLKNYLQDELARFFGDSTNTYFEAYVRTKLFDLGQYSTSNIAPTLFFEAQASLIGKRPTQPPTQIRV